MIVRVREWYVALTPRERGLVTLAAGLTALVLVVFGIVLPLARAHEAAHERHAAAVASSSRLYEQLRLLERTGGSRGATLGPVAQTVASSADAAGLVIQSNQPRGNDAVLIVVAAARPTATLAWLDSLSGQGIVPESVAITPAADGTVSLNATLRRTAP